MTSSRVQEFPVTNKTNNDLDDFILKITASCPSYFFFHFPLFYFLTILNLLFSIQKECPLTYILLQLGLVFTHIQKIDQCLQHIFHFNSDMWKFVIKKLHCKNSQQLQNMERNVNIKRNDLCNESKHLNNFTL